MLRNEHQKITISEIKENKLLLVLVPSSKNIRQKKLTIFDKEGVVMKMEQMS